MNLIIPFLPSAVIAAALWPLSSVRTSAWGFALGLAVTVAILAFFASYRLSQELRGHEGQPRPHLRFVSTEVAEAHVITGAVALGLPPRSPLAAQSLSAIGPSPGSRSPSTSNFVRVQIANDPPAGLRGQRAERVAAHITFAKPDGSVLIDRMLGRWAETPQQIETGRLGLSLEEAQLDIDPNGVPHPLDVAMKQPADMDCFAFNFENSQAADLRLEKQRLHGRELLVKIVLRGANTPAVMGEYVLKNHGADRSIELFSVDDLSSE